MGTDRFGSTAKVILYASPLVGAVGIGIPLLLGMFNFALLGSYLGIPLIFAPLIYYRYRENHCVLVKCDDRIFIELVAIFFVCVSLAIMVIYIYDVRPVLFYVLVALMSMLILFEILLFDDPGNKSRVILFQSMILMLCILWSVNMKYFFYISRTDPIGHVALIRSLIENGYVVEEVFGIYGPFPLWHILCAGVYQVTGVELPLQKVMFFVNGIIYSFMPPVIYAVSRNVFGNEKVALLSALFICINPDVIQYGLASISRSVVSFLFLLLILSLLRREKMVMVCIILIFPIVIYHTASTPFILVILVILYIYSTGGVITSNYIGLFVVFNLFYWMFYARLLFETVINNIVVSAPSGVLTGAVFSAPLQELFNYLHYGLLFFFIILGVLFGPRSLGRVFCLMGLVSVVVAFPGPVLLINKFAGNFSFSRFGQYVFPFVCLAASFGFFKLFGATRRFSRAFVVVLFVLLVFLSVSNDFVASDDPLVKRPFYTFYLTEQEIVSFERVSSFAAGYVMSDYVSVRYLYLSGSPYKSHILEIDPSDRTLLRDADDDVFLIRTGELSKRPLKLYTGEGEFVLNPSYEANLEYYSDLRLEYDRVYDSGAVVGHV